MKLMKKLTALLMALCLLLPGLLSWCFGMLLRKIGWIGENDLKLEES